MRKWRTGLRSVVTKLEEILESYESFIVGRTPQNKKQTFTDKLPVGRIRRRTREEAGQGRTPKSTIFRKKESITSLKEKIASGNKQVREETQRDLGCSMEEHIQKLQREIKLGHMNFHATCKRHMENNLPHVKNEYDHLMSSYGVTRDEITDFFDEKVYPHYLETRNEKRRPVVMECPDDIIVHREMILDILKTIEDYMEDQESIPRGDFSPKDPTPYHLVHGNKSESEVKWERVTPRKSDS